MLSRIGIFTYGVVCYAIFFCSFLYLIGFVANFGVPRSVDVGSSVGGTSAFLINLGMLSLFGLQHSIMARPWFKRRWTRIVPASAERSTYVLFSSLALILLYVAWQPLPGVIWGSTDAVATSVGYAGMALGFALVLVATFLIDHFDLVGLKQVTLTLLQRRQTPAPFQVRYLYKFVRHPLYLGWLIAFWVTPVMTLGHLMFALGMTAYILVAVQYEERDLIDAFGEDYQRYRDQVPMLVPVPGQSHQTVKPQGDIA